MASEAPVSREGTSAILISEDGRLLLQLRDDLPHVSDPGKISLFGGRREADESFSTASFVKFTRSLGSICRRSVSS